MTYVNLTAKLRNAIKINSTNDKAIYQFTFQQVPQDFYEIQCQNIRKLTETELYFNFKTNLSQEKQQAVQFYAQWRIEDELEVKACWKTMPYQTVKKKVDMETYEEGVQLLDFVMSSKWTNNKENENYMIADLMSQFIDRTGVSKEVEIESINYQRSMNSKSKLNEEYVNLIISLTLSIPYTYKYKTGSVCEQSNVLIDLAIITPSQQIAILIIDDNDLILDSENNSYFQNSLLLKLNALSKHWKIYCINLSQWQKLYQTRTKQEEFIKEILE